MIKTFKKRAFNVLGLSLVLTCLIGGILYQYGIRDFSVQFRYSYSPDAIVLLVPSFSLLILAFAGGFIGLGSALAALSSRNEKDFFGKVREYTLRNKIGFISTSFYLLGFILFASLIIAATAHIMGTSSYSFSLYGVYTFFGILFVWLAHKNRLGKRLNLLFGKYILNNKVSL